MKTTNKFGVLILLSLLLITVLSDNFQRRNLVDSSVTTKVLEKEIQVTQRQGNYYTYKVYSDNGKVIIKVLDKDLVETEFTFKAQKSENKIQFRAAYNKFVIVQQKTSQGKSVTYWVLIITKFSTFYALQSFPTSSTVDDQDFQFQDLYVLTSIVEYNEIDQILYVSLEDPNSDYDIYGIDLKTKSEKLITIGWFFYNETQKEKIVGGNSRVLVQPTKDQFWFDTKNIRKDNGDPTVYEKVKASSFTTLPIYAGGSQAYSYFSSYFQYVSLSSDKRNLTTFIYKGYQKTTTVYGQGSLKSTSAIKIFSNEQSYFLAIGSNDIYVSFLEWNAEKEEYEIWSEKLSTSISDEDERSKWLKIINSVIYIFYYQGRFFMLSQQYFYVYSITQMYEKLLQSPLTSSSNLEQVILKQMKAYLSTPARR